MGLRGLLSWHRLIEKSGTRINATMKKLQLACGFASCSFLFSAAKADQASLMVCINKFKGIGLSADLAYAECKQSTLGECIKDLVKKNFVAKALEKKNDGYLVDLGNDDSRWLEGGAWKNYGCLPYTEGPKRRQQSMTVWGFDSVNTWFRQGICTSESVELNQPYSAEEAKTVCELKEAGI